MSAGRPSKFNTINQEQLKKIVLKGFTDEEVADFFNITRETLNNYKNKYPDFFITLKDWKIEADAKVEKCLYQRALGYQYEEICLENIVVDGKEVSGVAKKKTTIKQCVPDVTAQIFWLKNRQPAQWREKIEPEEDESLKNQELNFSSIPEEGKVPNKIQRFLN